MDAGATPIPVSVTVCGVPFASSVIETLPLKSLSISGENVTLIVHCAPAGRLEVHVLVWLKGTAVAIPTMWSAAEPVLLNVMTWTALTVPIN